MGQTPRMLAPYESRLEVVACHPRQEVVACGFADGLVLLVRVEDGAEILAKRPGPEPVSALAWDAVGAQLAWGTESGARRRDRPDLNQSVVNGSTRRAARRKVAITASPAMKKINCRA